MHTTDIKGKAVAIGSLVKVLHIHSSVLETLGDEETLRVLSMLGEQFEVYDVDRYGRAWVEKWWNKDRKNSQSHSLGLEPNEIEVILNETR